MLPQRQWSRCKKVSVVVMEQRSAEQNFCIAKQQATVAPRDKAVK